MKKFKEDIFVIIDRDCYCGCSDCGGCPDCEDVYIAAESEQDFHLDKDAVVEIAQYKFVGTRKFMKINAEVDK